MGLQLGVLGVGDVDGGMLGVGVTGGGCWASGMQVAGWGVSGTELGAVLSALMQAAWPFSAATGYPAGLAMVTNAMPMAQTH